MGWFDRERETVTSWIESRVRRFLGTKLLIALMAVAVIGGLGIFVWKAFGSVRNLAHWILHREEYDAASAIQAALTGDFSLRLDGGERDPSARGYLSVSQDAKFQACVLTISAATMASHAFTIPGEMQSNYPLADILETQKIRLGSMDAVEVDEGVTQDLITSLPHSKSLPSDAFTVNITNGGGRAGADESVAYKLTGNRSGIIYGTYEGEMPAQEVRAPYETTDWHAKFYIVSPGGAARVINRLLYLDKQCGNKRGPRVRYFAP
jgi:hypothetical protein